MDPKDVAILIVTVGFTISMVGISYQLMRLVGSVTDNINDFRRTVKNVGQITDRFVKEQEMFDKVLADIVQISGSIKEAVLNFRTRVIDPLIKMLGFVGRLNEYFRNWRSR